MIAERSRAVKLTFKDGEIDTVTDLYNNTATVSVWGSVESAIASLNTLVCCVSCMDCENCKSCENCVLCKFLDGDVNAYLYTPFPFCVRD